MRHKPQPEKPGSQETPTSIPIRFHPQAAAVLLRALQLCPVTPTAAIYAVARALNVREMDVAATLCALQAMGLIRSSRGDILRVHDLKPPAKSARRPQTHRNSSNGNGTFEIEPDHAADA